MSTVYFWRENKPNGFLSQWYKSNFLDTENGIMYCCAEQYMMYQKAILFGDSKAAVAILRSTEPGAMKALGQKVKGFIVEVWHANQEEIVFKGNMLKFEANQALKEQLLSTDDNFLVEAAPHDLIWGAGKPLKELCQDPSYFGQNLLGKILERVREEIRKKQQAV